MRYAYDVDVYIRLCIIVYIYMPSICMSICLCICVFLCIFIPLYHIYPSTGMASCCEMATGSYWYMHAINTVRTKPNANRLNNRTSSNSD
jgi:hypothetical protein